MTLLLSTYYINVDSYHRRMQMTTQNRISIVFRGVLTLLLIGLLMPVGSAFAQGEGPGSPEKQQPVVPTQSAGPTSAEPLDAANVIQDSSFEASFSSEAFWSQSSVNFGTPICPSTAPAPFGCGNGGGTAGPHTGSAWIWFGGVNFNDPQAISPEISAVSQSVAFPSSCNVTLQFYLWIGAALSGSSANDYFAVSIDGVLADLPGQCPKNLPHAGYRLVSLISSLPMATHIQSILLFHKRTARHLQRGRCNALDHELPAAPLSDRCASGAANAPLSAGVLLCGP
jgi:hypothetical protein